MRYPLQNFKKLNVKLKLLYAVHYFFCWNLPETGFHVNDTHIDHAAMTIAGLVGDAQVLVRYMSAELQLYRLQRKNNIRLLYILKRTFQEQNEMKKFYLIAAMENK